MYLDPKWRILTVGDGDLSFSKALLTHHRPRLLEASVYDSEATLLRKYADNDLHTLRENNIPVHTELDITDPKSVHSIEKKFDLIVFQFPLIPSFATLEDFERHFADASTNTLNRKLLRQFLIHSFLYLLDEAGPRICYITSKEVKPYREWNVETSINRGLDIPCLGSMPFEYSRFPGYRIRNVNRDSVVPDTESRTFVWAIDPPEKLTAKLESTPFLGAAYCEICRVGPFVADEDRNKHLRSKRHQKMQGYEDQWSRYLQSPAPLCKIRVR
jgi:25S rRNA (uracil2634-N3)-methyltransferase